MLSEIFCTRCSVFSNVDAQTVREVFHVDTQVEIFITLSNLASIKPHIQGLPFYYQFKIEYASAEGAATLPLKIRAIVFIRVSGVRVDRAANTSDSGKQVWALIQRRTAFLHRRKGRGEGWETHVKFTLIDSLSEEGPLVWWPCSRLITTATTSITVTCTC